MMINKYNEQFEEDFQDLDYQTIVNFIHQNGFILMNEYNDGGFDVEDKNGKSIFLGMFDTYLIDSETEETYSF